MPTTINNKHLFLDIKAVVMLPTTPSVLPCATEHFDRAAFMSPETTATKVLQHDAGFLD